MSFVCALAEHGGANLYSMSLSMAPISFAVGIGLHKRDMPPASSAWHRVASSSRAVMKTTGTLEPEARRWLIPDLSPRPLNARSRGSSICST
jgi:hypothetical protein